MNHFTIKDIENLSGIRAHTIRIWEQRYSLLKPSRTSTNIRYYSNEDLKTILNIALLNKYGYKISHINRMTPADIRKKISELNTGIAEKEKIINDLIRLMAELDIDGFENMLDRRIALNGIEKTVIQIIFPFFERIGILWQTGHINPAQEHLITNITRQKIIAGIDSIKPPASSKKSFLLFLPEGEHHELGLLLVYYLLKSRGVRVFYIGANAPLKDVKFIANLKKPDMLYTHLTSTSRGFDFEKFLSRLSSFSYSPQLVISGYITTVYKKKIPANTQFKKSLSELSAFIASL